LTTLDIALQGRLPIAIKIDVEGYETEIINGAAGVLSSADVCCLLMELNGSGSLYGFDDTALYERMKRLGFCPYGYSPFDRSLVPLSELGQRKNAIFIREKEKVQERLKTSRTYRALDVDF
jgi:hypothetical protein